MKYEEIAKICEELSYRDKFRLAQLLIQLARKQEEEEYPVQRKPEESACEINNITYVAERLLKLKPAKKSTLLNSIGAMFQFQGGISDVDKERIAIELQNKNIITITETGKVLYPT
ncbi:hypothetical protein [Aeromonas sobria]|uniref:hypothetical protein n=1 Tax=Aeromonas sobria TaxID=646 RepID=UPI00111AAEE6|nr:hypothetical protein [Aeromonas sobria]TNH91684.1 hypothetical protein CF137_20920 [Aeromonas sobria]HEH9439786.1 hypothetical protein [Aeromonas sobria]